MPVPPDGPDGAPPPAPVPETATEPPLSGEETDWQRQWAAHHRSHRHLRRERPLMLSVWRGVCRRCPRCGESGLMVAYLKATPACAGCGESFAGIRTDDFAPWLSILVIGHLLVPAVISVERLWEPPFWVHLLVFGTLGAEMVLSCLPRAKGAALGLMWALGLRGDEHQY